jgi:hypothetical protein
VVILENADAGISFRLVVMSFNIWWIISVVLGAGVGEMLFGRFGSGASGGTH